MKKIATMISLLLASGLSMALNSKKYVADASIFKGEGWILRPITQTVDTENGTIKKYGENFVRIAIGKKTPLYYGDVIESEYTGHVTITTHSKGKIYLSPNTSIMIAPDFIALFKKRSFIPVMHLIHGKARFRYQRSENSPGFVSSIRAGKVKSGKFDYVLTEDQGASSINGLKGKLVIGSYSEKERALTGKIINNYIKRQYKILFEQVKQLNAIEDRKVILLEEGMTLTRSYSQDLWGQEILLEPLENLENIEKIYQEKSIDETKGNISKSSLGQILSVFNEPGQMPRIAIKDDRLGQVKTIKVRKTTKNSFESIIPNLNKYLNSKPSKLSLRVGMEKHDNSYNKKYGVASQVFNLDLILRPYQFIFASIGLSRGTVEASRMADYLGRGAPNSLNQDFNRLQLMAGFYGIFKWGFGIHVGAGVVDSQEVLIQYSDNFVNVNRTYTLLNDPIPWVEFGFSLHRDTYELYLNYGQGEGKARIVANELNYKHSSDLKASGIKLGFGFPL